MSKTKLNKKDNNKRYFKYSYNDDKFKGRYFGIKPKQAGSKVLKRIVIDNDINVNTNVHFKLKECTRGSKKKIYNYVGKRIKLKKPVIVKIGDIDITYNYTNELKKYKIISVKS